ncbi:MAG: NAD(P)-dependent oxidoreductase [Anaerococcus sp.]|nr:NAD(P)-dependent oxidoreductase [Anaerococcus sp.]
MKISVFNIREEEKNIFEAFKKAHPQVELVGFSEGLTLDNLDKVSGSDSVSLSTVDKVEDELLEELNKMGIKVISQRSAGFDMYNLEKLDELGMKLINVPRYSPNAIGEYAASVALYFTRNLDRIFANSKKKDFRWVPAILSKEMRTMTVGIVGTGNIGRACGKLFKGLGAKLIGYDPYESDEAKKILDYVSLEELYQRADVISYHLPATKDNYHMVDDKAIAMMKDGVVLINAARGSILDTKAVLRGLDSGKIRGCGLDVYEEEFDVIKKDLSGEDLGDEVLEEILSRDDIIYTPHIAFYTETALDNLMTYPLDQSIKFLESGDADSVVNR